MAWYSDWFEEFDAARRELMRSLWDSAEACLEPLVEIEDKVREIILTMDLPCVDKKEDISIRASEDSIEIDARLARSMRWENWGTVQKRVEFRSYRKTVRLPSKVDPERAHALFRHGILRLKLPKAVKKVSVNIQ